MALKQAEALALSNAAGAAMIQAWDMPYKVTRQTMTYDGNMNLTVVKFFMGNNFKFEWRMTYDGAGYVLTRLLSLTETP